MTTPTIEEMARTICLAVWNYDYTPRDPKHPDERWVQAMNAAGAVIEKHFGPMLHGAYTAGFSDGCDDERGKMRLKYDGGSDYAARALAQLKCQSK